MRIEHECPQCGAPVVLDETDRLLSCGFCKTKLFIQAADHFRYSILPHDPFLEDVFYVPYWRYRGMHFLCKTGGVENGLIDKTFLAADIPGIPQSLGLRAQSLKLTFARPGKNTHFLKPAGAFDLSLAAAKNTVEYDLVRTEDTRIVRTSEDDYDIVPEVRLEIREEHIYHETFLADTVSIIYAPYYVRSNKVYDGVTDDATGSEPGRVLGAETTEGAWKVSFLPTICPNCGWDTISGRDSCIVFCAKCDRAWRVTEKGLFPSEFSRLASNAPHGGPRVYLPFWRVSVTMTGTRLDSYADFIRFANRPRALQPSWEDKPFYFWLPAFKTTPSVFLRTAKQLTIASPEGAGPALPPVAIIPVNLPLDDAFSATKTVISDLTMRKKTFLPTLPDITIAVREASLVLLPFIENNQELVQPDINFSLFKNTLKVGGNI